MLDNPTLFFPTVSLITQLPRDLVLLHSSTFLLPFADQEYYFVVQMVPVPPLALLKQITWTDVGGMVVLSSV